MSKWPAPVTPFSDDIVNVSAAPLRRRWRCARRSMSARSGRSGRCRALQQRGELDAFLGRIIDDEHAVDAGRLRIGRRSGRRHSARSDSRSPSARPASRCRWREMRAPSPAPASRPMPRASARSLAFWITGPSAIGSLNGTPSSMMSAPAAAIARMIGDRAVGVRIAGRDVGDQRLAACVAQRGERRRRCGSSARPRASSSATVSMSLSPRPERLTSRCRSARSVGASFIA